LLSCDTEGFGNVNLEAQALKIPVITTTVGGNPETIIDGVTGFLIPPRNTDMLISSIKKLITDKLMSDKMAIAGEKFVKETFSKQKLSSSLTDIYDGVLK